MGSRFPQGAPWETGAVVEDCNNYAYEEILRRTEFSLLEKKKIHMYETADVTSFTSQLHSYTVG